MSTDILDDGNLVVTRFVGGINRGTCYQLNGPMEGGERGYVQYTAEEAKRVAFVILEDVTQAGQAVTNEIKQGTEWGKEKHHGRCFFCLECICGHRAIGWDLVFQTPTCGPCLERVRYLQDKVFGPRGESLYEKVGYGDWATDVARAWDVKREKPTVEF